ncbi:MAG: hypothetical protein H6706_05240 [Myxococcales bacterium]|nr:hypothetical protein [Myxococcales bacterium]
MATTWWRRGLLVAVLLLGPCAAWAAPPSPTNPLEVPAMTRIVLIVDGQTLTATLDDTAAGRDFARLLPLDLRLADHARTEKIADLPRRLDTEGAPDRYAASAGDLTWYAPWGNLAIFYRDFPSASGLVRLGRLDGGVEALRDATRVRIELAGPSR